MDLNVSVILGGTFKRYTLKDVVTHHGNDKGYYYIKTKEKEWYFPINFTILETENGTEGSNNR